MNLNKVLLIGRLTEAPKLKKTPGGHSVISIGLATNRSWFDKANGERKEESEFHALVVWGKQAETMAEYMERGQEIFVEGRLQTRTWQEKKSGASRKTTEVLVERFQFGNKAKNPGSAAAAPKKRGKKAAGSDEMPDELPILNWSEPIGGGEAVDPEAFPFK